MKKLQLAFCLTLLTALSYSCSKDKKETEIEPPYVVEGYYDGKIGIDNVTPNGQFALRLKADGTIARINGSGDTTALGTWQLNGTNFAAFYASILNSTSVNLTGVLDKESHKLSGNWVNNSGAGGKYVVTKL